jgi:hypothetical protein
MKKPILKGPKLIAVGPLKCFKGGGSSGGNSGGGSNKPKSGGKGGGGGSGGSKKKATPSTAAERRGEYGEHGREMDDGKTDVQGGSRGKFERDLAKEVKKGEMKRKIFGGLIGAAASPLAGKAFDKATGPYSESDAAAHMAGEGPKPPRGSGGPRHGGSGGVSHRGPQILPSGVVVPAGKPSPEEPKPEVPKTPSQMTEAELEAMLAKRARGEDSIVEKEAKLARERGLAQQLSSIRGARGATAGQKLRALQRGGSKMGVELGAQTAIAKAKEQEANQKALLAHKRGDREAAEKYAHLAGSHAYKYGSQGAPSAVDAQKVKRDQFGNILKTGKKIYDVGKGLGSAFGWWEEGGKVEGPGTETSDSISAKLSDGEFVVKASAVRGLGKSLGAKDKKDQREKGVEFLYKLQDKMDKKVEKFGGGGSVESKNEKLRKRQKLLAELKAAKVKVTIKKPKKKKLSVDDLIDMPFAKGGEIKADPERFLKFMDKGVSWSLNKKNIQKSHLPKEKKKALLEKLGEEPKFAKGGEAYVRPKKAFREAIGYEPESRFHDKAEKDAKFGGARRKFRHFKHGGEASYGDVVAAQKNLNHRLEKLEKRK